MKFDVTFWGRNCRALVGAPEEFEALTSIQIEAEDEDEAAAIAEGEANRRYINKVIIEIAGNIIEL